MSEKMSDSNQPIVMLRLEIQHGDGLLFLERTSHDRALLEEQCEWLRERHHRALYFNGVNFYLARDLANRFVSDFRQRFEQRSQLDE